MSCLTRLLHLVRAEQASVVRDIIRETAFTCASSTLVVEPDAAHRQAERVRGLDDHGARDARDT